MWARKFRDIQFTLRRNARACVIALLGFLTSRFSRPRTFIIPAVNRFFFLFLLLPPPGAISAMVSTRYAIAVVSMVAISRRYDNGVKIANTRVLDNARKSFDYLTVTANSFARYPELIYNVPSHIFRSCRSKIAETGRSDVRLAQVDPKICRTGYCNTVSQQRIRYVEMLSFILIRASVRAVAPRKPSPSSGIQPHSKSRLPFAIIKITNGYLRVVIFFCSNHHIDKWSYLYLFQASNYDFTNFHVPRSQSYTFIDKWNDEGERLR